MPGIFKNPTVSGYFLISDSQLSCGIAAAVAGVVVGTVCAVVEAKLVGCECAAERHSVPPVRISTKAAAILVTASIRFFVKKDDIFFGKCVTVLPMESLRVFYFLFFGSIGMNHGKSGL